MIKRLKQLPNIKALLLFSLTLILSGCFDDISVANYRFEASLNDTLSDTITGEIDEDNSEITLTVPYDTDITGLIASFDIEAQSITVNGIEQISGETPNDFSSPVIYTVTASNNSMNYTVIVEIEAKPWIGTQQISGAKNQTSSGIALDATGNIYIAGTTDDDLDDQINSGSNDAYLVKYNASGEKQWSRLVPTPAYSRETASAVTTDASGNVYLAGITSGQLVENNGSNGLSTFLTKYNAQGDLLWTSQVGTPNSDRPSDLAVDSQGNVYMAGTTGGDLSGQGSAGANDIFVIKFSTSGNTQWIKQIGTSEDESATDIAINSQDQIYVTGGSGGDLFATNLGEGYDLILIKLDSTGNLISGLQSGTDLGDIYGNIQIDMSDNIYLSGQVETSLNGQPYNGYADSFLQKFNAAEELLWTTQYGTEVHEYGASLAITENFLYVAGGTDGDLAATNQGYRDIYLSKFDLDGHQVWATQFGTTSLETATGIATNNKAEVFMSLHGLETFTDQPVLENLDSFVMKFNSEGQMQ